MPIHLRPPTPADAPALGEIVFTAFRDVFIRHGLEPDFPDAATGIGMMTAFVGRPDVYGVVAEQDGKIVGSNFAQLTDPVAGVGPITVDPHAQAGGVGRLLMKTVVDHCLQHHGPQVRLVQDAINMVSLSLYTSLGFAVREPLVLMQVKPATEVNSSVRPATVADIDACSHLCERTHRVSRRGELAGAIAHGAAFGMTPFVRERAGRIVGYVIPTFLGHGAAEGVDDILAILTQVARRFGPFSGRFLCPSRNHELFKAALAAGCRGIRACHMMSIGPYEEPQGTWFGSIAY